MADYRKVLCKIWEDEWFCDLAMDAKLFFLYLVTNDRASVAGIYRLPLRSACFETGLTKDRIVQLYREFEEAGKAKHHNGIVWVKNLRRYQASSSPRVQARIKSDLDDIPPGNLKAEYLRFYSNPDSLPIEYPYGMDTVSGANGYPIDTETFVAAEEEEEESTLRTPPTPPNGGRPARSGSSSPLEKFPCTLNAYQHYAPGVGVLRTEQKLAKLCEEWKEDVLVAGAIMRVIEDEERPRDLAAYCQAIIENHRERGEEEDLRDWCPEHWAVKEEQRKEQMRATEERFKREEEAAAERRAKETPESRARAKEIADTFKADLDARIAAQKAEEERRFGITAA